MKVKKAIKRIAALGVGATMLGATVLGAMAADLSNYPNMFITNGQFNGYIVVGEKAKSSDTLGAANIAMGLQSAAVTKTTVCTSGSTSTTSVSEGVKIDKSSSHMYYNTDCYDVQTTLDSEDLPTLLANGEYSDTEGATDNDEDYTQEIRFTDNTCTFKFTRNNDKVAGDYLYFSKSSGDFAYTYLLEFDTAVEYSTSSSDDGALDGDIEGTEIDIQGRTYTITKAEFDGSNVLDKLTLMAGETTQWIQQGQKITKTLDGVSHEVEMIDVTENEDACGLKVDGTTVWVDVGDTKEVNGLKVGVLDAKAVHSGTAQEGDICKINLGSQEIVLEDGKKVEVDGTKVDGSKVMLSATDASSAGSWTGLNITWTPDDKTYLAPGDELVDPVFGNFKFVFGGAEKTTEEIKLTASSDDATLTFTNSDGKEVEIPMFAYTETGTATNSAGSGNVSLPEAVNNLTYLGTGSDVDELLYLEGDTCYASDSVTDCEGAQWLIVKNGEAHVLELTDIDTDDNKTDFRDVTYGTDDEDNDFTDGSASTVYVSGLGNIEVTIDKSAKTVKIDESTASWNVTDAIETKYKGYLTIALVNDVSANNRSVKYIRFTENDDNSNNWVLTTTFASYDSSDGIQLNKPTNASGTISWEEAESDSDYDLATTVWGSTLKFNAEDKDELIINHPDDQVQADVYVSPTAATLTSNGGTGEGCQTYETVNKIPSSVTKYDTEITSVTDKNIITVGGPCVNSVTATLLGNPEVCTEGFEAGKAMIKLVENGEHVALIVAGYSGEDTRLASIIMQNYDQYSLSGKEMTATTVSESSLSVAPVSSAPAEETTSENTTE